MVYSRICLNNCLFPVVNKNNSLGPPGIFQFLLRNVKSTSGSRPGVNVVIFRNQNDPLVMPVRYFQSGPGILESHSPSLSLHEMGDNSLNVEQTECGEKLYLTPYLKNGRIQEAQAIARVQGLGELDKIQSYSGYLSPNSLKHLFFWFFPAMNNSETAPVILWLNGGPGASSMFGLFAGHGPFFVDSNFILQPRKTSWTLNHSVLYIDSPVGTGFSFTDREEGYTRNLNEVVEDVYEALNQFFVLFPQFSSKDFYIAGQSYTGKYAPAIAHRIHRENSKQPRVPINLKGLAIGSGLCDPLTQADYGEYLYNIGLIDEHERSIFDNSYKEVCRLIKEENWTEAHKILQHLVIGWPRPIVSRFETVSGYSFNSNYLYDDMPDRYAYYIPFLQSDWVRRAIHVGNQDFGKMRNKVYELLADDFPQSVKPLIEELLDSNYRILFYASQLDIIVPHTGIDKFVNSLKWKGADEYSKLRRSIWKSGNCVAGYSKEVDNLVHLLIRNAGHVAPHDQPEWCFDMITRFTRGTSFF